MFLLLISFTSQAIEPESIYRDIKVKEYKKDFVDSLLHKEDKIKVLKTLSVIEAGILSTEEYNYYQKYLLRMNALIILKSSFYSDSKPDLIEIAKEMFHVQLCTTHVFQQHAGKAVYEIVELSLYDNERKVGYNKASEFFYSEDVMNAFKKFVKNNKGNLEEVCK